MMISIPPERGGDGRREVVADRQVAGDHREAADHREAEVPRVVKRIATRTMIEKRTQSRRA
jgi:hypothetical protein